MSGVSGREVRLGYRLPDTGYRKPTEATRIIYRLIDYDEDTKGNINIFYVDHDDAKKPFDAKLDEFITKIIGRGSSPPLDRVVSPLDTNCSEQCYLVFQLSSSREWQFSNDGDCFTTKDDEGEKYTDLWHVDSKKYEYPSGEALPDGCRILYLRANCRNVGFRDGFNLCVDLLMGVDKDSQRRRTRLIIDPDIRNPGGNGDERAGATEHEERECAAA